MPTGFVDFTLYKVNTSDLWPEDVYAWSAGGLFRESVDYFYYCKATILSTGRLVHTIRMLKLVAVLIASITWKRIIMR